MSLAAVSSSPQVLWFLTRGTGVVTLVLLTITLALGIASRQRLRSLRIPRFVINGLHRNAALLAVAFLAVHVITTVLDGYVQISVINAVLPFSGTYRPLWLGLGAISLDLMIAVVVTSLLRKRIGYRAWRATHWLAYASWPVAMAHSLGMGTDRHAHWMLAIALGCAALVALALAARLTDPTSSRPAPATAPNRTQRPRPAPAVGRR